MNITDVQTAAPDLWNKDGVRVRDMLLEICRRQHELETKYEDIERSNGMFVPEKPLDLDDAKSQWFIKDGAYRCIEELSEATNCLKNKPWKTTQVITDETHFLEELADALHFMVRLFIYLAGTPEAAADMMYRLYFKKSEVNLFRQNSNY